MQTNNITYLLNSSDSYELKVMTKTEVNKSKVIKNMLVFQFLN